MKTFDTYEIHPCHRLNDQGQPDPDGDSFEVCGEDEAHIWTLYGHIPGEGILAIGDFASRESAAEVYSLITGRPFGKPDESAGAA